MQTTQGTGQQLQTKVESSLEASLRKFNDLFNRYDRKGVAACFTEDGTLITPSGEYGNGRTGVERVYGNDVDRFLDGSTSKFTILGARSIGNDCAFLDLEHDLQNCRMPDGSRGGMKLHLVILAQRKGKEWLWADARPYAFLPPPQQVH
jgi:ketosteroid isomerase-like protein